MAKKEKSRGRPSLNARIADVLRERVASMKPGEPFGTEVAIADECGVSRMTARKAVNALVEEGLLERRAGVGLFVRGKGEVTRRWRFIAGNLMWDPAIKAASGARREAQKIGAELELKDAGGDMRALLAEIAALPDSGATGAIVFSVHAKAFDAAVHAVAEKGFPIVVVDEDLGKKVNVSCVVADNVVGGRLAAELTGETPLKYDVKGEDRLGDWGMEVRSAVVRIVKRKVRPTAVFCSCDAIARHAMRAFAEVGISVPGDMSLVGFDDDPVAEWTTPALTTVRQDFMSMGREAVKALVARIAKPAAPGAVLNVPVEFISRESLARHSPKA